MSGSPWVPVLAVDSGEVATPSVVLRMSGVQTAEKDDSLPGLEGVLSPGDDAVSPGAVRDGGAVPADSVEAVCEAPSSPSRDDSTRPPLVDLEPNLASAAPVPGGANGVLHGECSTPRLVYLSIHLDYTSSVQRPHGRKHTTSGMLPGTVILRIFS